MTKQATAKTPTVAIARVLRSLGLEQGKDFRVRGQYQGTGANRERIGTYVGIYSAAAEQTVADNADRIEELVKQDGGFAFRVSIHRTASGRVWTWIANFGKRTREGHFMDTDADRKRMGLGAGTTGSDAPSEDARKAVKDIEQWIAERMERAGRDWPKGTRVSGLDSQGIARTGTVNGVDVGMVVEPGHDNYGRTFVGVNWDAPERPELGHIVRNRPFTDSLTRV